VGIEKNRDISKEVIRLFAKASPGALLLQDNDGRTPLSSAIEKKLSNEIIDYLF